MVLSDRLESEGVTLNVVFPGRASTAMTGSLSLSALPGVMKLMYPILRLLFADDGGKSAAKAARSTIWGATTPELEGVRGRYFDTHTKEQKLHPTAYDSTVQGAIITVIDHAEAEFHAATKA